MSDFAEFALVSSKAIAEEEVEKMYDIMIEDLRKLLDKWSEELLDRIDTRLTAMGLDPEFGVTISWQPDPPIVEIIGKSYEEEQEDG